MDIDARIALFRDMILCCHELYLWTYDSGFHLITSNCPDQTVLNELFAASQRREEFDREISASPLPIIFTNELGMMWVMVPQVEADELLRLYVLGPFLIQEFSEYDYEFKVRNNMSRVNYYPQLVHNVCSAGSASGTVIDSDGLIYKCWNDIGIKERAMGNLLGGLYRNYKVSLDYLLYDPTQGAKCKMCQYIPICMGGCPHRRQFLPENRCHKLRYTMDKYISDIAQQMKAARQTEKAESQAGQEQI